MIDETQTHEDDKTIEFYDLKARAKVHIPVAEISKTEMRSTTSKGEQIRYAIKAKSDAGASLTKFVSKAVFDSFANMPVVETVPKPAAAPKKAKKVTKTK